MVDTVTLSDGTVVTDDTNSTTGIRAGGHTKFFIKGLSSAVYWLSQTSLAYANALSARDAAITKAAEANASAVSAGASAATALSVAAQNLTAISTTAAGTVVASFVYDTTKDSDGGAWRERCSHLSWYNETLNTATRGAARKFPASVDIVVYSGGQIVLYDKTDVTAPMWAILNEGTNRFIDETTNSISCVFAINGEIFIGINTQYRGIYRYNLISETGYNVGNNPSTYVYKYNGNFATRNDTASNLYTLTTLSGLVSNYAQCITATVLPTAPIDNATGLPIPTVWVGTLAGVSRIADDGTVSNWTEPGSVDDVYNIGISGDYVWWSTTSSGSSPITIIFPTAQALVSSLYYSTTYNHYSSLVTATWASTLTPLQYGGIESIGRKYAHNAIATNRSLTLLQPNTTTWGNGLHATITKDFNSGYQFGDIRGAWLSQGTAETLTATDLVTGDNSTFTSGVGSWTTGTDSSIAAVSGKLECTSIGSNASVASSVQLVISVTPGKTYVLSVDLEKITGRADVAMYQASSDGSSITVLQTSVGVSTKTISFKTTTATAVSINIGEQNTSEAAGLAFRADNITVKLAEPDVSYKNQALTVVGSIVKSAVATGCDLMAYSGWSASNYMQMAYNSAYDFGTGDFHISCWCQQQALPFARGYYTAGAWSGAEILILNNDSYYDQVYIYDSTRAFNIVTSANTQTGWHKIDAVRRGNTLELYSNGVLSGSTTITATATLNNSNATIRVGTWQDGITTRAGACNLLHASANAPTAAQIKSAYDREKLMFVSGAKCLLPGTSNDVKAVDYDDSTYTHHYVTGDYYGAHKWLVRVDSAAGVYTSISAKNGAVIKGA